MTDPAGRTAGFQAFAAPSLRARGVRGKRPEVVCLGDVLEIRGEDGSVFPVPAAAVRTLRLGVGGTGLGTVYMARLFLDGDAPGADPLHLRADNPLDRQYGPTMRCFAHAVAKARGLGALESGNASNGRVGAVLSVLGLAAVAAFISLPAWTGGMGTGGAAVFTIALTAVVAVAGWEFLVRDRVRPITSIEQVDKCLPRMAARSRSRR